MGFTFRNPIRRDARPSALPSYEPLNSPTKERFSRESDYSDDDSDDYLPEPSPSSTRSVSDASSSHSSAAMMLPKHRVVRSRRTRRLHFYRLPNKVVRYICVCIMVGIVVFIMSLVRASQVENRKLAKGEVPERKPPPPIWESFPFLTRYYGGIKTLVPLGQNKSEDYKSGDQISSISRDPPSSKSFNEHKGTIFASHTDNIQECFVDAARKVRVPPIRYYDGRPEGFPDHVTGSYELFGLAGDVCFDRYGKYGPYGFGYSVRAGGLGAGIYGEQEGSGQVWNTTEKVNYHEVDWADAQRRCYQANAARYKAPAPKPPPEPEFYIYEQSQNSAFTRRNNETGPPAADSTAHESSASVDGPKPRGIPRTAVVLRCWDEYFFREEDIMNIRSIITELALASGGRYDIHLLVQIQLDGLYPVWADPETIKKRFRDRIPKEFHGIVTIWTVTEMLAVYQGMHDLFYSGPDLPVHGVYRGLQMAMQYFAYKHPEYDYFWQWEMDIRYTGHYYDLFAKLENWAREQPRKGLWERNARFYLPSVHGSWEDFKQMARVQAEMGKTGADNVWNGVPGMKPKEHKETVSGDKLVWGPERPQDEKDWFETENDPEPPTSYQNDKYTWGVGEEADLISFNPIFDPEGTTWKHSGDITGYNTSEGLPPRKAHIISAARMSRRLLMAMHRETALRKHFAFPEMWPATVALQHGYKAVFAPHPTYVDREWPINLFAQTINNGKNGASGGSRTSVFGQREHNLQGSTWFYGSHFAPNLYRRWLGLKVDDLGGEVFEMTEDNSLDGKTVETMRGGEGRMCLPPMLLHPIKDVELPVEVNPQDLEEKPDESDPSA